MSSETSHNSDAYASLKPYHWRYERPLLIGFAAPLSPLCEEQPHDRCSHANYTGRPDQDVGSALVLEPELIGLSQSSRRLTPAQSF